MPLRSAKAPVWLRRTVLAGLSVSMLGSSAHGASGGSSGSEEKKAAKPRSPLEADETLHKVGGYYHRWIELPDLRGRQVRGSGMTSVHAEKGRMTVVVFLASWCSPCQRLVPRIEKLRERFSDQPVRFAYVFAHDTQADATGFMKEFDLDRGILANDDILEAYHNPKLPTLYVGDRHGWLLTRYEDATRGDLADLSRTLRYLTAF